LTAIDSTIYYAEKALEAAKTYQDQENLYKAAIFLYDLYKSSNEHQAFLYYKIASEARDSLMSIDKIRQEGVLSFNQQIREKEKKLAELKEAVKTRMIIVIAAILISITSFLIWSRLRQLRLRYKMILKQKEAEKLKAKYEKELLELEAKALRAQMNPHFIYNCMNSIKALIQNDEKLRSIEYLTTFSKLIRTIFHNSDKRQISLHDEIETCKLYTQLESMRLNGKLKYNFCIDHNLDLKSLMVPALIVQPFIENAVWHGIVPNDGGTINISIKGNEETIICEVDDDGIGRETSKLNKPITPIIHESKGVHLSQQRLNLEKILNDNIADFEIIDKYDNNIATGTKVILKFNLN
jgi:LytS/YehU family sensor histidine kinase